MSLYNPNVPTGLIALNQDYQNIRNNFTQLNTTYGTDHIPYDNTTSQNGYHKVVHMVPNVGNPAAVAGIGELYCRTVNDGINNDQELFYQTGAGRVILLTRNFVPTVTANGATFLPGGLILNYGRIAISANPTLTTVTFTQAYSSAANVFSITLTRITDATSTTANEVRVSENSVTATNFKISSSSSSSSNEVYWMAIGI